jgi:hypothetical protein
MLKFLDFGKVVLDILNQCMNDLRLWLYAENSSGTRGL